MGGNGFIKKHIKFYLALLVFFSVSYILVYASDTINLLETCPIDFHASKDEYTQAILANLTVSTKDLQLQNETKIKNPLTLITAYCASILNAGVLLNPTDGFLYSPRQSAFLYLLCGNIDKSFAQFFTRQTDVESSFSANFSGYFKVSDFDKLGLPVKKDKRHLAYLYVDDLFNTLMNEYFTIKQANVYGFQTDDTEAMKIEEQVNDFSSEYFKGINICSKSDDLGKKFPKTCTYMTQYLNSAKKMFKDLNIMNTTAMFKDYQTLQTTTDFCSTTNAPTSGYQIMLCGLWGDEKSINPFVNLVYNELFYYNLFVKYFGMRLNMTPDLLADITMNDGIGKIEEQQAARVNQMETELAFSKGALNIGLRILRNAYVTFPLHIGFLMYWEGLQEFGKSLAPIATPVYTLYDKFRNVQCIRQ